MMIPTKVFFTKGVGKHKERLASFEAALRDAGIAFCNLVYVSSILPPDCKIISKKEGFKGISPGQIIYTVMSRNESDEPNRLIASAIGCAVHSGKNQHGYLSEHHSFGQTDSVAGDYAEDLAASMLASTIGIEFDTNVDYDKRKEVFRLDGRIVRTFNITQSARVDKHGLWTTVIAAAVFLFD